MNQQELARLRFNLVSAVTEYDRKQSSKASYNMYALPQYLERVSEIMDDIAAGADPRDAITAGFTGTLLSSILRKLKMSGASIGEMRGTGSMVYEPVAKRNPAPASRKENYDDFDEWETDAFRAGATQVVRLGEDLFSAIKMKDGSLVKLDEEGFVDMRSRAGQKVRKESITVGSWYGDRGEIYRQMIRNNPVRPRRGESSRDFVSRCMSEERESFPAPKQRIAVCLSKSRRRNPVYDTGSDE